MNGNTSPVDPIVRIVIFRGDTNGAVYRYHHDDVSGFLASADLAHSLSRRTLGYTG